MPNNTDNSFDPLDPEYPHDDFPAVARVVENLTATFVRMREFDDLDARAEVERERVELYRHIADLIEVGGSFLGLTLILGEREAVRRRKRARARQRRLRRVNRTRR